ncbi:MAG TPA: hypothetical protein VNT30_09445 [Stellaceae bacterium]|nr:hypothetical protein [Stellaceae bacterium]
MADFWDQALAVLETGAPAVATLAGGPLAGQAVSMIEGALGLTPTGDKQLAGQAVVGATAEQLIAMQTAGLAFKQKLVDAGIAMEQADDADRASARAREISVQDWTAPALAIGITLGFFGLLGFLCFREVPTATRDLLNVMIGSLGAAWTGVVAYYFGSSSGQAHATELLAKAGPVP